LTVWRRIGANVRATREACGLSQEALGALCKLPEAEVAAIERGERDPGVLDLIKIATALRTTPAALMRGIRWELGGLRFDVDPPTASA
jgi:transcriptional regulator with XRE-family HTH domain